MTHGFCFSEFFNMIDKHEKIESFEFLTVLKHNLFNECNPLAVNLDNLFINQRLINACRLRHLIMQPNFPV